MEFNRKRSTSKGFTLMELMIAVSIVGIIAAIAIPSYLDYTRKAYFSEIVKATAPYKAGVAECYHRTGAFTSCAAGSNGIPAAITSAAAGIGSLAVAAGVVTVTPVAQHGLVVGDTYVLTPTVSSGIITWTASGGGVTKGYAPSN